MGPASPDFGDLGFNLCKMTKNLQLTPRVGLLIGVLKNG